MVLSKAACDRATELLGALYGCEEAEQFVRRLMHFLERTEPLARSWPELSEQDALLITYGNTFNAPGEPTLATLSRCLEQYVGDCFSLVHLLPIFPYSSDDGFSVVNYRDINPELGDWETVGKISDAYGLALDLVINHCSRSHLWFQDYIRGELPGSGYFIEADPADPRLALVARPRNSPLLTPVEVRDQGVRHVWTTFSADQVDLDFSNPSVLMEFVDILLTYIRRGARVLRLDAIAYLWKSPGTSCINLEETHAVVKFLRLLVDAVAPGTLLLTETNVPPAENLAYLITGDEAHLIYQFSLAPLLLYSLVMGETAVLGAWIASLPAPPATGGYVNFTASHDGVGLRPLEGLISDAQRERLLSHMRDRGGYVSMRRLPDGRDAPYELNISYFDALGGHDGEQAQFKRFLLAQTVALSLQGIPAIYVHSLIASSNDLLGVERSGQTRAINRRRWDYAELRKLLDRKDSIEARCLFELRRRLQIRRHQPAFHPQAEQRMIETREGVLGVLRTPPGEQGDPLLCLFNFTYDIQEVDLTTLYPPTEKIRLVDVLGNRQLSCLRGVIRLPAYGMFWIKAT